MKSRTLYNSPNGDRWLLVCDEPGAPFVCHEANRASGGKATKLDLGAFLSMGAGPEQQELLRLIGALVDEGEPSKGL
jgi:hypothetical protein